MPDNEINNWNYHQIGSLNSPYLIFLLQEQSETDVLQIMIQDMIHHCIALMWMFWTLIS